MPQSVVEVASVQYKYFHYTTVFAGFRSSWSTRCNMVANDEKPLRKHNFFASTHVEEMPTTISLHAPPSERKIHFKIVICHLNCLNNDFPLIPRYNFIKYWLNIRNHHQDVEIYLKIK